MRELGRARWEALDILRGVAILLVVACHYTVPDLRDQFPALGNALGFAWTGVDLFFALSGFLIGGILIDHRSTPSYYTTFYARRLCRIVPLYLVLLAIPILTAVADIGPLWPYLTFTQNYVWGSTRQFGPPWTGVTWSLAVEEQFYLILPLLIRVLPLRFVPWLALAAIVLAPVARIISGLATDSTMAAYMFLPCRMDALFVGLLVAWAVRQPTVRDWMIRNRGWLWTAALMLGLLLAWMTADGKTNPTGLAMSIYGFSTIAAFYGAVLVLVVTHPSAGAPAPLSLKPLRWLGVRAYGLYLFHPPIQYVLSDGMEWAMYPAAILAAALAWEFIERPCIEFGQRRFLYTRPPQTSSPRRRHHPLRNAEHSDLA